MPPEMPPDSTSATKRPRDGGALNRGGNEPATRLKSSRALLRGRRPARPQRTHRHPTSDRPSSPTLAGPAAPMPPSSGHLFYANSLTFHFAGWPLRLRHKSAFQLISTGSAAQVERLVIRPIVRFKCDFSCWQRFKRQFAASRTPGSIQKRRKVQQVAEPPDRRASQAARCREKSGLTRPAWPGKYSALV